MAVLSIPFPPYEPPDYVPIFSMDPFLFDQVVGTKYFR